jgi:nucleoside-diphosphate-sugar epimerase
MTAPSGTLLVTGATGLVGREVVRQGLLHGYRIRAMGRASSDRSSLPSGIELIEADLLQPETLAKAVAGADLIVHTAAKLGDWGPMQEYRAINVVGLEHLLRAAEQAGTLKRLVHISSLSVYPVRDHHGTDENDAVAVDSTDPYSRSKVDAEFLIAQHRARYGLPAVVLRPGTIYGAADRLILPRLIKAIEDGTMMVIGPGDKHMNNTYVENLGDAVMLALTVPQAVGETFNIRDERLVTRLEYFAAVADFLGKPHPRHLPPWVAGIVAGLLEGLGHVTGRETAPLVTKAAIKFLTLEQDFSIAKARQILNYRPKVDFRDGIRVALAWAAGREPAGSGSRAGSARP